MLGHTRSRNDKRHCKTNAQTQVVFISRVSQRYANVHDLNDSIVIRRGRLQDPKNRQNSIVTDDARLLTAWEQHQRNVWYAAMKAYDWAIENGIAKEQARCVLPEGNTASKLYVNGTIRSWIHYVELRSDNGTQKEHMEVAQACAKVISEIFPLVEGLKGA